MDTPDDVFDRRLTYPDTDARRRFNDLVGIDAAKTIAVKSFCVFFDPTKLENWGKRYNRRNVKLVEMVLERPPLIILAGDVGTGKTELAESLGDPVARELGIGVTLFPVSLSTRGEGRVGEMTKLISSAFEYAALQAERVAISRHGRPNAGIILLIDEADALAQSREISQMHHEDRAGVNAFVRGIDRIAGSRRPAGVIMCTNRLSAIDPAVRRRAAEIIEFSRPDEKQAAFVLSVLSEAGLTDVEIARIAEKVTNRESFGIGCTYSDLTQRLLPSIVLSAYPDRCIDFELVERVASNMVPTPPFREE